MRNFCHSVYNGGLWGILFSKTIPHNYILYENKQHPSDVWIFPADSDIHRFLAWNTGKTGL